MAERKNQPQAPGANIKDTIESILVAFILAFIFRAFVVEAFVIPTGSMATTLLGAHMRFHCPDCGWQFDVNYTQPKKEKNREDKSEEDKQDEIAIPNTAFPPLNYPIYCPNCGYTVIHRGSGEQPPVYFGDRILVLKYLYLFQQPQRWDVVVFKSPDDPKYQLNYIKRLVGKPSEKIMILDGDIYKAIGNKQWQVQTKPRAAQEAMWRLVYNNDYYPQGLDSSFRQPWEPQSGDGWKLSNQSPDARVFHFDNPRGSGKLLFNSDIQRLQESRRNAQTTSDYLAYDQPGVYRGNYAYSISEGHEVPVNDLKLNLFYTRRNGDGPLRLILSKYDNLFTAEITPTAVRLIRTVNGRTSQIGQDVSLDTAGKPLGIEFSNVDYQVTVRINGRDLIQTNYAPDINRLKEDFRSRRHQEGSVAIEAGQQVCDISHVSLWRDIYYTNTGNGILRGDPNRPIELKKDEYFVCGDNTLSSSDARLWEYGINLPQEDLINVDAGRVPARFMLGKAFFVYWPAGYRPISEKNPGIVPNFGDMRFIH